MTTITTPAKADPQLLDLALDELAAKLASGVSWIDQAFGKAERLAAKDERGAVVYEPVIYTAARAEKDYYSLFPNDQLGNFSWFDVQAAQTFRKPQGHYYRDIETTAGLVVWLDFRTAWPTDYTKRTVENAKADVLEALLTGSIANSSIEPLRFTERAEEVFRGYNHREADIQFRMRPYACFRLDINIIYKETRIC